MRWAVPVPRLAKAQDPPSREASSPVSVTACVVPRCFDWCVGSAVGWTEASDLLPVGLWGMGKGQAEQAGLNRGLTSRELLFNPSCLQFKTIQMCSQRDLSSKSQSETRLSGPRGMVLPLSLPDDLTGSDLLIQLLCPGVVLT